MVRPRIAPFSSPCKFRISFRRFRPIVGRTGFFFGRRADESELLDPRDVVWIRAMQIGMRNFFLVQLDQHILLARFREQKFILALGTVAPENVFGFRQFVDFVHPIENGLVRRLRIADPSRREYGRRDIFHATKVSILTHEWDGFATAEFVETVTLLSRLRKTQCAALIESMFGVTTSDDYRPVAWMGRYPVDVTTMLVGLHVVLRGRSVSRHCNSGPSGTLNYFIFDSTRIW